MIFKICCRFASGYFFLWLLILLVTSSTKFLDERSINDKHHIERFTNSVMLSNECKVRDDLEETFSSNENYYFKKYWAFGINCDISGSKFHFKFQDPDNTNKCYEKDENIYFNFNMQLTFSKSRNLILADWFRFDNLMKFVYCFKENWRIKFRNLKGFDINLFEMKMLDFIGNNTQLSLLLELSNFELSFYSGDNLIKSCDDMKSKIFNLFLFFEYIDMYNLRPGKEKICPLLLQNNATEIQIYHLANTFYKSNVPKFIQQRFDEMNTKIEHLKIHNSVDIELNLEFLHPSIFKNLEQITILKGSLNSISIELFESLKNLRKITIFPLDFRELNHKAKGIEWIKAINRDIKVDLNGTNQLEANINRTKFISIDCIKSNVNIGFIKLSEVLPEKDFCLYRDFPFHQMVVFMEDCVYDSMEITAFETTCTYLWFYKFLNYFRDSSNLTYDLVSLNYIFKDTKIFKMIDHCNFEQKLRLCNKSNYQVKDVWTASDYTRLNKIFEFTFRISIYIVSLFGIITNLLVIIVILHKTNSDIFDGFKQYVYLGLNSAFSLSILLIQLCSWLSECFWPYQVFCPRTHQFAFFQYFKIIFQVMIINALRFMCNFSYSMFAINRIAVIVKGQNEVSEKISNWGVKKFLAIAFFLSLLFSSTKYFNYVVNIDHPEADYPIRETISISLFYDYKHMDTVFKVIFLLTAISDFLNHFVFTCVNLFIDIVMLVKLRRSLAETDGNEESMKIATRMVVINSLISILLKMPLMILPIINVMAQFYYSNLRRIIGENKFVSNNVTFEAHLNRNFGHFYYFFQATDFPDLIDSLCNFLFSLSLLLGFFVYFNFDEKIHQGFNRIFNRKIESETQNEK